MNNLGRWALILAVVGLTFVAGSVWQAARPPAAEASGAGNDLYLMATAETPKGDPYCYLYYRQYDQLYIFHGENPVALYTLKELSLRRSGLPMNR